MPPTRPPPRPEPALAKWTSRGLAGALIVLGLSHLAIELAMFVQLRLASSWWAGLLSLVIGALGLSPWSCLLTYHHALATVGVLFNSLAAVLDMRTQAQLRDPSLRCGPASKPVVAITIGEWCALDQRRYSCGCIIPGSEPGDTDSCVAFHSSSSTALDGCDLDADRLGAMVTATAILCWTLAAICLVASMARLLSTCYINRRCPGCLEWLWHRPEESVPPYLRNGLAATIPTGPSGRGKQGEEDGEQQEQQRPSSKARPSYYMRDCPGGAV